MDSARPSFLQRALAVVVILVIAAIALRLVVGLVTGLVTAALWIVIIVAMVAGLLWARSTLKSARSGRRVKPAPSTAAVTARPAEDPVAAEMRRITEQLREQGRG